MIKFADKSNTAEIRKLWDTAFGDDRAFNDYYFENIFKAENTLISVQGNNILSMAQMLPYRINGIGDVTYIYGAATRIEYRGRGLMRQLLNKSFDIDKKMGRKASVLIPAEKSLFDYYNRLGYKTGFYVKNIVLKDSEKYEYFFKKADDTEALAGIYNGDVIRDSIYFNKQINMFRTLGGEVFALYDNGICAYAFVWNNDDMLYIQELMATDEKYISVISNHIMKYYNRTCAKATINIEDTPFGMIKYYDNNAKLNMYMNLMYN